MTLARFNKILAVILSIITIITSIYLKKISLLIFLLYIILPFIFKLKPYLTIIYLSFGFLSIFNGTLLHLYKLTMWYDSLVHFIWGIVSCLLGIVVLKYFNMDDNILFNCIFILLFSTSLSSLWEIIEFIVDTLFKLDMQRRATGVYDTMKDIIVALLGNILFIIWYLFEYKQNKKLLIRNYIDLI
jgi:hypothetical protein